MNLNKLKRDAMLAREEAVIQHVIKSGLIPESYIKERWPEALKKKPKNKYVEAK